MRFAGVLCWVIVASFWPFFWFSNVIVTQSEDCRVVRLLSCGTSWRYPSVDLLKNCMFRRQRSFVFLDSFLSVCEYLQDLIAKKRAPMMRLPIALSLMVLWLLLIAFQTISGSAAWWFGGGLLFLYALIWRVRIAAFSPVASRVGSGRRLALKAWTRSLMVEPTVFPKRKFLVVHP